MVFNIDNELKQIADNISIFINKDEETKRILKQMGLRTSDISDRLRREVKKASSILMDNKEDPKDRIDAVTNIVNRLNKSKEVPIKIRELILSNALKRLDDARSAIEWEETQASSLQSAAKISRNLDLFLSDSKENKLKLRKMGITEIPESIKKVARDAQEVLKDKKLDAKERAIRAADILMEPLQPVITGDRSRKDILELPHEIKSMLWEIANDFTYSAAKR